MEFTDMTTEAAVVADLAKQATEIQVTTVDSPDCHQAVVVGVPKHLTVLDLSQQFDEYRGRPRRLRGVQTVHSINSFVELVTLRALRKDEEKKDSILYLNNPDGTAPCFTAVLNEHGSLPGFRDYRVQYAPKLSREWKIWLAGNGKTMTQTDFAEFLEAQCLDVIDIDSVGDSTKNIVAALGVTVASPPALKSIAREFVVKVKQEIREARSLASGETHLVFKTEHTGEDGKPLVVPGAFLIAIPIFENGPAYTLVVRLRYRLIEGRALWAYSVEQMDKSQKDCLDGMAELLKEKLPFPLIEGSER